MTRLRIALALLFASAVPASADLLVKDGAAANQTMFDFTCFTTKHCSATVTINSAGTEIFTSGSPGLVTLSGTNTVSTVSTVTSLADIKDGAGDSIMDATNNAMKVVGIGIASGATTSGTTGSAVMCATTTAITGGTTATTNWLNCTPAGALRIDTATLAGTAVDTSTGNASAGTQRVVLATNQPAVATSLAAGTTGGCTPAKTLSAATQNATSIKGSAGTLCKFVAINTTATVYYLKTYDKATAPTCASDTVLGTYPIPPSNGGVAIPLGPFGEAYTLGIGFCLTGALADADASSAATGVTLAYSYK
jgi:hypothetical protein